MKNRTRRRWRNKTEEFNEVDTNVDPKVYEDFEDAYPEFFNPVTKKQTELTDAVLNSDIIEKAIDKPMSNMDDFISIANTIINDSKDLLKQEETEIKKPVAEQQYSKLNLQTFIVLIRDLMLTLLILKVLLFGIGR